MSEFRAALQAHLEELQRAAQFEAQAISIAQQRVDNEYQAINAANERLLRLKGGIASTEVLIKQFDQEPEGKEAQDGLRLSRREKKQRERSAENTGDHPADDTASG